MGAGGLALGMAVTQRGFWSTLLIFGLVIAGLFAFGILSLATSLFTAVGVGIAAVGAFRLVTPGPPMTGLILFAAGVAMIAGGQLTDTLTVGEALTLASTGAA